MDITQQGVLALLKAAVTGEATALSEEFDIAAACSLMQRHHVLPLLYEGAIRCGISPTNETMARLFRRCCSHLLISEKQLRAVKKVCDAFDENGIDYLPLKGCRMKALYPRPELRVMGDADILIRLEQYERIAPLMAQLGFRQGEESDHELIWESEDLYLELHKHLIPSYNEDLFDYFATIWQRAARTNGGCHEMTAEDEFVYLFTHFAKHFRDGGIGCRHVLDLWVYLRQHRLDGGAVDEAMARLGLSEFYGNIRRLLAVWFEGAQTDEKTELIGQFIFESGSFASQRMRVLFRTARATEKGGGRLAYLCQAAFPTVAQLEGKYTVLKKAPWLLPAVWVYRPFYKLVTQRSSLRKQQQNLAALETEALEESRLLLQYVGLK
jgi:hypothetical protein